MLNLLETKFCKKEQLAMFIHESTISSKSSYGVAMPSFLNAKFGPGILR